MGSSLRRSHHAWLLKIVFVLGAFVAAGIAVGVVSGADQPAISSDRSEYAPGETVVLSGDGWQAGETVAVVVDDDQDDAWTYESDVVATEDGTLSDVFELPDLAGEFTVSANAPSGAASASFTVTASEPEDPPTEPAPPCVATGDEALATDKTGYLPGALAVITGTGFGPSCDAELRITLPDETTSTETVSTDADGAFSSNYTLPAPAVAGDYLVEALGGLDAVLASITFEGLEPTAGTPFIWTDRDDYKPGETFVLRGSGWLPGETVQILVDDDDGETWTHTAGVVAGVDGTFTNQFKLPDWFVAVYTVTATGALSGTATTTFTDAVAFGGCGPYPGSPPHTINVNTTTDEFGTGASCSLREGIRAANQDSGADTIVLPAGTYQLTIGGTGEDSTGTGDLDVLQPVTITGAGARTTIIQAGTTTANGIDRVFHITSAGTLTMSQVTVQFGRINNDGGGIRLESSSGTALSLTDVTVRSNTATATKDGGGISAAASLTLNRVTVSGNTATQHGGGLQVSGAVNTLTNVTITDNTASQQGGGIRTTAGATTLTNVTVSHNAGATGGGIRRDSGTISLRNTIVSNSTGANCSNGSIGNAANNLEGGANTCGFGTANGSQSSTSVPPANAMLGNLLNNGGPTDTRALGTGSTAIDRGTATSAPNHDQRNVARPQDGDGVGGPQHDVGAYEAPAALVQSTAPTVTSPICAGATSVSGTSTELPVTTTIEVFKNSVSVGTTTVAVGGTWTKTGLAALVAGDVVKARATAVGKSASADSNVVTVIVCNTAPVAFNDAYPTNEDTPLNVAAPGVLVNDTDAELNTLTAVLDTGPANAVSFTLNANGSFAYTPTPNFHGTTTFTYHANDGTANSNTATVTITVNAVNDAPSFTKGADQTVDEDAGAQSVPGWATAISPGPANESGQTVSFVVTSNGNPSLFSVAPAVSSSGTLTYTPAANAFGSATIDLKITDDGGTANGGVNESATQSFQITVNAVNDAPSFTKGADQTVDEDAGAQSVTGWATAISAGPGESGQTVSFVVTSNSNPSLFSVAPAVSSSGTLTYTPAANAFGSATIDLKITDDGGTANGGVNESATQSFQITVAAVNDPPQANTDAATVAEDSASGVLVNVLADDSTGPANESAQTLTITAVTQGTHGSVAIEAGQVRYIPTDANFFGADSFTYTIRDDGQSGSPLADDFQSDSATVNVTVTPVNDPPQANTDAATVAEDSASGVLVNVLADDSTGPANESAQTLTITAVTQGTHGSVAIEAGQVRYIPTDANFFGADSFTYTIRDDGQSGSPLADDFQSDSATVNVTVTPVNDPPQANTDAATVAEDSASGVLVNVLADDSTGPANESAQTLTITAVTQGTHGSVAIEAGQVRYIPTDANFFGADSFTYTIRDDGQSGSPLADDFQSDSATVNVTVTPVNDPPQANTDAATVAEDSASGVLVNVLADDSTGPANESAQTLTITAVTQGTHGSVAIEAGQVRYIPTDANFFGADSFTYTIRDDGQSGSPLADDFQSDSATVNVTVTPVNDPPQANTDAATVAEDSASGVLVNVLADDSTGPANESAQTLTITAVTQGTHGSVAIEAGQVRYIPTDANFFGADSFTYTIRDDGQSGSPLADDFQSDSATVNVTVTPVNDPPQANTDAATVAEDSASGVLVNVLADDSTGPANESAQTLTITAVTQGTHGSVAIEAGQVRYIPTDANFFGADSFTYTIRDDGQSGSPLADDFQSDTATVNVTVTPVNDPPVVTAPANKSVQEGSSITVSATFTDVEVADAHTCTVGWGDASSSSGTVVEPSGSTPGSCTASRVYADDNPTGTPADNYTVTITVGDNGTTNGQPDPKSDSDTLVVTVNNVAPTVTITAPPTGSYPVGVPVPVSANFTDPGKQDTHTCTINGGAGAIAYTPPGSGTGTCTGTATPSSGGSFTVTVVVRDDDSGVGTASTSVGALYSIYAHERCSGGAGKGIIVNGARRRHRRRHPLERQLHDQRLQLRVGDGVRLQAAVGLLHELQPVAGQLRAAEPERAGEREPAELAVEPVQVGVPVHAAGQGRLGLQRQQHHDSGRGLLRPQVVQDQRQQHHREDHRSRAGDRGEREQHQPLVAHGRDAPLRDQPADWGVELEGDRHERRAHHDGHDNDGRRP